MHIRQTDKKLRIIIWAIVFFAVFTGSSYGEKTETTDWQTLGTRYTIIYYQNMNDLLKFNKNIDYSPGKWGLEGIFSSSDPEIRLEKLKKKVDALFSRVQRILDMRKRIKKVSIRIYHDKKQLHDAYYEIFKTKTRMRAWYIYRSNTIYVNMRDLHEGMLVHEMAHHIIDNYFRVRPPPAAGEILARYVDKHLFN